MNKETKQYIYVGNVDKQGRIQLPSTLIKEIKTSGEIKQYVEIIHNKESNELVMTYRKAV